MFDSDLINSHRIMNFKTIGHIRYNPDRGSLKTGNKNWAIVELLEDDLSDYYRFQFYKKYGITLYKPSWKPHLSIIKGWELTSNNPWGWRDGEDIEVEYGHQIFWKKNFVWINAHCNAMDEIKNHYNFEIYDGGHLTIGRIPYKNLLDIPRFCDFKDLHLWEKSLKSPF